jgi:hypothetical protein
MPYSTCIMFDLLNILKLLHTAGLNPLLEIGVGRNMLDTGRQLGARSQHSVCVRLRAKGLAAEARNASTLLVTQRLCEGAVDLNICPGECVTNCEAILASQRILDAASKPAQIAGAIGAVCITGGVLRTAIEPGGQLIHRWLAAIGNDRTVGSLWRRNNNEVR